MARAGPRQKKGASRDWRWFLAEYAVVFAGVLTALAAEQLASTLNQRSEVREARRALDTELGWNLTALQLRHRQSPCVERRLDELDRWVESWSGGGRPLTLTRAAGNPVSISFRTSVWRAASDVVGHMPFEEKVTYAQIYDDLENSQVIGEREVARWQSVAEVQLGGAATPERKGRIKADTAALRRLNAASEANYGVYTEPLKKLGIKPAPNPANDEVESYLKTFCSPILEG
jgi:hypothetical protein